MHAQPSRDAHALSAQPKPAGEEDAALLIGRVVLASSRVRGEPETQFATQDRPPDKVFKVLRGTLRSVHLDAEGGRRILAFHLPGEVVGLGWGEPGVSIEAVQSSEVLVAKRSVVEAALTAESSAASAAIHLLRLELSRTRAHEALLSLKGAVDRVAGFLVQYAARLPATGGFELPMSRSDIADHLALTIESVSRAFTQLEREGAIRLPRARQIEIVNRAALRRAWAQPT